MSLSHLFLPFCLCLCISLFAISSFSSLLSLFMRQFICYLHAFISSFIYMLVFFIFLSLSTYVFCLGKEEGEPDCLCERLSMLREKESVCLYIYLRKLGEKRARDRQTNAFFLFFFCQVVSLSVCVSIFLHLSRVNNEFIFIHLSI